MTNLFNDYINAVEKIARESSDDESYAYMLGYFQSSVFLLLEDLDLNKRQLKVLENKLKKLEIGVIV